MIFLFSHVRGSLDAPQRSRPQKTPTPLNNPPEDPAEAEAPPARAQVAVRADGVYMVDIKDGADRDFTGRTVVQFLLLNPEENALAAKLLDDAQADFAARVLGRLPKR